MLSYEVRVRVGAVAVLERSAERTLPVELQLGRFNAFSWKGGKNVGFSALGNSSSLSTSGFGPYGSFVLHRKRRFRHCSFGRPSRLR
jgi:hypothetical protein